MKLLGWIIYGIGCGIIWHITDGFFLPFAAMMLMLLGELLGMIGEGIFDES